MPNNWWQEFCRRHARWWMSMWPDSWPYEKRWMATHTLLTGLLIADLLVLLFALHAMTG